MKNIALIGFMATGKTLVGKKLAKKLKMHFLDTDELVEKKLGLSIPIVFQKKGEKYFRTQESKALVEALGKPDIVLATGGGVVLGKKNRIIMRKTAITICLKASFNEILTRVKKNCKTRPLLQNNPAKTIKKLLKDRQKYYAMADYTIVTTGKTMRQVIREIIGRLSDEEYV